jgi:hypothetical protein
MSTTVTQTDSCRRQGASRLVSVGQLPTEPPLRCRVRLPDERVFDGELLASRHRAIQLGMLHSASEGFVEVTPGTRQPDGRLHLDRRGRTEHFLPVGRGTGPRWLERALYHAEEIIHGAYARKPSGDGPREECFIGVAARIEKAGGREYVIESRWLWVDVDDGARLEPLYAFLVERPCHLMVQTAGRCGGVHCYWQLDRPLLATGMNARSGELTEAIEAANLRLIEAVGADRQCRDRGRVLRLAGSPNWKTGHWARIVHADFALEPYSVAELVGHLPDPEPDRSTEAVPRHSDDPYRRIPAVDYMLRIAGRRAGRDGKVRCPAPDHPDEHPSCSVTGPHRECWQCQSCGAGGGIYDLASIVLGGPYGRGRLHGEAFGRARALVVATYGELR